jgi:hypothetical protein
MRISPSKLEAKCQGAQMQFHELFQPGSLEELD